MASGRKNNLDARQKAFDSMGKTKMVNGRVVSGTTNSGAFHKPGSCKK